MDNFTFNTEPKTYNLVARFEPAPNEGTLEFYFDDGGPDYGLTGECLLLDNQDIIASQSFENNPQPTVVWEDIPYGIYMVRIEAQRHGTSEYHPLKWVGIYLGEPYLNYGRIILDPIEEEIVEFSPIKLSYFQSHSSAPKPPPTITDKILVWVAKYSIFVKFEVEGQNPIQSIKVWKGEALPKHIDKAPTFNDPMWEDKPSIEKTYNDTKINFYETITDGLELKSYFIKLEVTDLENQSTQFVYPNLIPIGDYKTLKIEKHPDSINTPISIIKINDEDKDIDTKYEYAMGSKIKISAPPVVGDYKFECWDKQVNNQPSSMEIGEDPIYINLKQDTVFYVKYINI